MVQQPFNRNAQTHPVILDKTGKKSFGICIVRGEVKDSPNSKTSGIFIKGIVPQSPAHLCGKLKVGDRILFLNDKDVRNATEQNVIDLIKDAGMKIHLEIQTFDRKQDDSSQKMHEATDKKSSENRTQMKNEDVVEPERQTDRPKLTPQSNSITVEEDDEDTRDMMGRMYTEAGYEIDRASAGNCKLNKLEQEKNKEIDDEFGYTMAKIRKRYSHLKDLKKCEVIRTPNKDLGLALAGHRDRQKMACFVAGIHPQGIVAKTDMKPGDEILEVNGNVLQNRCHLNASVIFKNIPGDKIVFVLHRRKANDEGISVKHFTKFPAIVDETQHLFKTYKNVRTVHIQKSGFLGLMVIEGKHAELGKGIFVSDLRADSNAEEAGVEVGDLILAINKDVILQSSYDEAVAILKRVEGIVTLILCSLKSEEQRLAEKKKQEGSNKPNQIDGVKDINDAVAVGTKESDVTKETKVDQTEKASKTTNDEKQEQASKKTKETKEVKPTEAVIDPATIQITPNTKINIEINAQKKPLGCIVSGGKNNFVKTGCNITHIYPDGVLAQDKRLVIFDQIIEANGVPINCSELTTLKVHQLFHLPYEKITLLVWRNDPPETETFKIEVVKKSGKELGISLAPNEKGATISDMIPSGYAEIDNKLQRGDIITKFNGDSLENSSFAECYALFKGANGKICLDVVRPKPTVRQK